MKKTQNSKKKFFFNYLWNEIKTKPQNFRIGFVIVFISVFVCLFLLDFNQLASFIFLRLAEKNIGDSDMIYTIDLKNKNFNKIDKFLINESKIQDNLKDIKEIGGASGRWLIPSLMSNLNSNDQFNIFLIITNTLYEKRNGFGRNFDFEPLKNNEIIVNEEIFYTLGLKDNVENIVNIEINPFKILNQFGIKEKELKENLKILINNNYDKFIDQIKKIINNGFSLYYIDEFLNNFGIKLTSFQKLGISFFVSNLNKSQVNIINQLTYNNKNFKEFLLKLVSSDSLYIKEEFIIKKYYEKPQGMFQNYGNNILLDMTFIKHLFEIKSLKYINKLADQYKIVYPQLFYIIDQIKNSTIKFVKDSVKNDKNTIFNYFPIVNIIFKNKEEIYSDLATFEKKIVDISNSMGALYEHDFKLLTPLSLSLKAFNVIIIIIKVLLKSIVIFLISITLCIIYAITNFYIGESNYEFGMLRSLGFELKNIRILNSFKNFIYSIPSTFFAISLSFVLVQLLVYIITSNFKLRFIYKYNYLNILFSIFIGIYFVYIISVFAIKKALKSNLKSALEFLDRDFSNYVINVIKLSKLGVSKVQMYLSLWFIFYGVIFIYLIPKFLNDKQFENFLLLVMFILYLILIGFNIVFILLLPYIQTFLIKIFTYPFKNFKCCYLIIKKNLESNSKNNIKAFLIISLIVSFIIFNEASIKMQTNLIINFTKIQFPSDIYYRSTLSFLNQSKIDEQFKNIEKKFPGLIKSYSFSGISLNDNPLIRDIFISNSIGFPKENFNIYPINEKYMNSIDKEFFIPYEYSERSQGDMKNFFKKEDEVEIKIDKNNILSENNKAKIKQKIIKFIIPTGSWDYNSVKADSKINLYIDNIFEPEIYQGYGYLSADLFPGFFFTKYQSKMQIPKLFHNFLISESDYIYIQNKLIDKYKKIYDIEYENQYSKFLKKFDYENSIPVDVLNIKFSKKPTNIELGLVQKLIEIEIDNVGLIYFNTIKTTQDIKDSLFYFDVFNIIILVITLFLCFFILFIFFLKKLKENIWEFSVMRAIGVTKNQGIFIFLIENLTTLLSGLIAGLIVGIIISLLSILQFNVLIEIPFEFIFPYISFSFVVVLILFLGFLVTYIGLKRIINLPLSNLLKGFI